MPTKNTGKTTKATPTEKKLPLDRKNKLPRQETGAPLSPPSAPTAADSSSKKGGWTFLTNHSHVIILLANKPDMVLREVASEIGITERAVQRIIADLEEDGFLIREKIGRQNHYRVVRDLPLRHPIEAHRFIGDLVDLILNSEN
jgi:biotin operon repressor